MPIGPLRLCAFSLSLAAHLGLFFALGNAASAGGMNGASMQERAPMMASLIYESLPAQATDMPNTNVVEKPAVPEASATESPTPSTHIAAADPPASSAAPGQNEEGTGALPILIPTEPRYFELSELSAQPTLVRDIAPGKMLAVSDEVPRSVVMRLLINEQGAVDKVEFEDDRLPEPVQKTVGELFASLRFQPGKQGERTVKSQMKIEVMLEDVVPVGQASALATAPAATR